MSVWENALDRYVEARLALLERQGKAYSFRNNSFSGRIQRYNGSTGYVRNGKPGMPDRVALVGGTFVGIEYKKPGEYQSKVQKEAQETIESAGGKYFVVRTSEEFEEALKGLL